MRLGVHLVKFDFDGGPAAIGPTVAAFGAAAEEAGFDRLSVMDHYFQIPRIGHARDPEMFEAYNMLGYIAARTSTAQLRCAGDRRDVPQPGDARQAGHRPRCAVGRPGVARYRRGLVRARARRASASTFRRSRSASNASRRCSRSCLQMYKGARTTGRTKVSITNWPRHCGLARSRCSSRGRRSW